MARLAALGKQRLDVADEFDFLLSGLRERLIVRCEKRRSSKD
jgi:hypothetical protein